MAFLKIIFLNVPVFKTATEA